MTEPRSVPAEGQGPLSSVLSSSAADEDPRQLAAKLVNALYRLVKACQLHAETNQAVAQVTEYVTATVAQYVERAGVSAAAILFTPQAVFVNRQMLKASRETYQLAIELGAMLEPCGVTEITLTREITIAEVADFGRVVADFVREGKKSGRFEGGWEGLKLRRVVGLGASHDMSPPIRAARTYAAALMILRSFYTDLKHGKYELRQGIKRVAQKLVSQTDTSSQSHGGTRLLLSIAAAPPADADRSGILLSSAVIALAMASQLTNDRSLLTALTSAALLYDAGRQRLIGYEREGETRVLRTLNADEEAMIPTSSLVALTALGKLHPPNIVRSVIIHEAQAIRDGAAVYQGRRSPLLLSRVLCAARAFAELRLPRPATTPLGIDDVIQVLESQAPDNVGRALVKLLVGALGIFPAGTMVELSTGEMGVVLSTPRFPVDFARPPVRILYDKNAQLLEAPIDLDLARSVASGEARRFIKRPIDATDQQMKQMRAYVMQLATNRARRKSLDKMKAVQLPKAAEPAAVDPRASSSVGPSSGNAFDSFGSANSGVASSAVSSAPSSASPSSTSQPGLVSRPPLSDRATPSSSSARSAPSSAVSSGGGSDPARSMRPPTMRWDPRAEDAPAVSVGRRAPVAVPSPSSSGKLGAAPAGGETRSVSWDQYGKELAVVVGRPAQEPTSNHAERHPDSSSNETDSILAAYLAEEGAGADAMGDGSQGGDPSQGGRSWGLRWSGAGGGRSSQGSDLGSSAGFSGAGRITGSSAGTERDSSGTPSNAGLRWGSQSKSSAGGDDMRSDIPDSVPIQTGTPSRSTVARTTGASAWTAPKSRKPEPAPPPVSEKPAEQSTSPLGEPQAPASEVARGPLSGPVPSEMPLSRRAKAGSTSWGARKDGKK